MQQFYCYQRQQTTELTFSPPSTQITRLIFFYTKLGQRVCSWVKIRLLPFGKENDKPKRANTALRKRELDKADHRENGIKHDDE